MSNHTPGPWYVRDFHPDQCTYNIGSTPDESYTDEVAIVFRAIREEKTLRANANLIAAAPELLEVLRRVRDQIDDPHMGEINHKSDVELVSAVRVAVAKAEGRS